MRNFILGVVTKSGRVGVCLSAQKSVDDQNTAKVILFVMGIANHLAIFQTVSFYAWWPIHPPCLACCPETPPRYLSPLPQPPPSRMWLGVSRAYSAEARVCARPEAAVDCEPGILKCYVEVRIWCSRKFCYAIKRKFCWRYRWHKVPSCCIHCKQSKWLSGPTGIRGGKWGWRRSLIILYAGCKRLSKQMIKKERSVMVWHLCPALDRGCLRLPGTAI